MHLEGESGIPRFTDDFPKETGVFDLEYEWSHQDVGAAKWK
jgi:hypothetical protein